MIFNTKYYLMQSKKYKWERYNVDTVTTYYWDKYNANSSTNYTGTVNVSYQSGSQTVTWSPKYPRNDPPRINTDSMIWDNLASGTWDGWDAPGSWIVRSTSLSYNCYYVTALEQSGTGVRFTYSKVASPAKSTTYSQGTTSYGEVTSTASNTYPTNGRSGSYWYVYKSSTESKVQGSLVETVTNKEQDAYPTNGIHTDGYWYVLVEQ